MKRKIVLAYFKFHDEINKENAEYKRRLLLVMSEEDKYFYAFNITKSKPKKISKQTYT